MSMPVLVEDILGNLTPQVEGKLNVMHVTFLVMDCSNDSMSIRGHKVFTSLYSKYFDKTSEVYYRSVLT